MKLTFFRALTFLSAFLLFSIQPLTGKLILPMVGGTPQGWLVTLAFFQTTLVAGYGFVYLTRKLDSFTSGALFVALLAYGLYLFSPSAVFAADPKNPAADLFLWLWQTRGLLIVALGATAPFTQRLFAKISPDNPYKLYAVSNTGSFLGLLAYPFFIEPFLGLQAQTHFWQLGYMALIALAATCVLVARSTPCAEAPQQDHTQQPVLLWLALAAIPTAMLSGVTLLMSTDIVSFPLLWVIPLALYLGTFIWAFDGRVTDAQRKTLQSGLGTASAIVLGLASINMVIQMPAAPLVLLGIFTVAAFLCHDRLYALRPAASQLPLFYLMIAVGGALGGSFTAFVAPVIFNSTPEFYLALSLALVLLPDGLGALLSARMKLAFRWVFGLCAVLTLASMHIPAEVMSLVGIVIFICVVVLVFRPVYALVAFVLCVFSGATSYIYNADTIALERNFFGILKVYETKVGENLQRQFMHGTTLHGVQLTDPDKQKMLLAYYGPESPISELMRIVPKGPIAAVGLGAGQMACYGTPARPVTYYEIDPDVVTIAQRDFTYLRLCPVQKIVMGDARLSIQNGVDTYTGIVLDAFTSDGVPTHLLTREAITVYRQKLRKGGYLLFHISNKYLDLRGVLAAAAADAGMTGLFKENFPAKEHDLYTATRWFVLTDSPKLTAKLEKAGWATFMPNKTVWSDDRFSILDAVLANMAEKAK